MDSRGWTPACTDERVPSVTGPPQSPGSRGSDQKRLSCHGALCGPEDWGTGCEALRGELELGGCRGVNEVLMERPPLSVHGCTVQVAQITQPPLEGQTPGEELWRTVG